MNLGDKFTWLTVVLAPKTPSGKVGVMCDCGKVKTVDAYALRVGLTKSCGCYGKLARAKSNTTHGHNKRGRRSPLYKTWANMLARCLDQANPTYRLYGGRGITVHEPWKDFSTFLLDVGDRPANCSLDRVDGNGNYEPGNVRWATDKEQARNKRNNRVLTHDGKTMCVADWVDATGLSSALIINRIEYLGWSVEKTLSTPARKCKPRNPPTTTQESQ